MSNLIQNLVTVGMRKRSPYDPSGDPNAPVNADWESSAPDPYGPHMGATSAPPAIPVQQSAPDVNQDVYMPQLRQVQQQLTDAYAPRKVGTGHQILGALVGGITHNPQLGGLVTGDTQRARQIQGLTGQEQQLTGAITQEHQSQLAPLTQQNTAAEVYKNTAEGNLANARIPTLGTPKQTPQEEMYQGYLKASGGDPVKAHQMELADAAANRPDRAVPEADKAISDALVSNKLTDTPENRDKMRQVLATRNRAPMDDLSRQLKELQVQEAQKKVEQLSPDEQRRADLATNLNENLDQLEEIAKRRPELFGPVAGRMTEAKGAIGSSDPDVAKLRTIKEQMGMAMIGTHALRNAQHIEASANSIINSYHSPASAVLAAIGEARNSSRTFMKGGAATSNPVGAVSPSPSTAPGKVLIEGKDF